MNKFSIFAPVFLVALVLAIAVFLIANDKDTAGFLAIVTALVPIVTLLLKPQKDDDQP